MGKLPIRLWMEGALRYFYHFGLHVRDRSDPFGARPFRRCGFGIRQHPIFHRENKPDDFGDHLSHHPIGVRHLHDFPRAWRLHGQNKLPPCPAKSPREPAFGELLCNRFGELFARLRLPPWVRLIFFGKTHHVIK